ncbi:membrane bound O-acyl transferase family-domain-containing protein [Leptodontidium sp. MPI-SDFR-AT-0119]|nr:membrane bound O-acyl transferase family-domain-containing protein [Leptodontidium sp. MPI-SDFR-AT-0119]
MLSGYFIPDKARPLAPRPHLIPSIYLTCVIGSLLPQGKLRALSVTSVLIYLIAQIPKFTTGVLAQDSLGPIQATLSLLHWLDFFVFHSQNDWVRAKDAGVPRKGWKQKLGWSWDLNIAMRGIGWNWRVNNVPGGAPVGTLKWKFVRKEIFQAALSYLLFDLSQYPVTLTAYATSSPPDLFADTWPRQMLLTWLPALASCYALKLQYSLFAAMAVATGVSNAEDWPPIMGKLADVSTVRDLWGKFWHQLIRRKLNIPFRVLKKYVPIQKGTLTSRYLQLYLAFIASGLLHHLGALNLPSSSTKNNWNQLAYFFMQPIAITVEDIVIHLGKKAGIKKSWKTKAAGAVWTFAWFTFSLRYMVAYHFNALIFEKPVVPSLIRGWVRMTSGSSSVADLHEL